MTNQSQGANALSHPFYLNQKDLEGITALRGAGSMLALKFLEQARKNDPIAMPREYVDWANALDKANAFLKEVDFRLKLAEKTHPTFAMSYNFTKQEVLSLNTLRETVQELLTLVNDVTKQLLSEGSNEQIILMRVQICNLRTNHQYHATSVRAFDETIEKEAKSIMTVGKS